ARVPLAIASSRGGRLAHRRIVRVGHDATEHVQRSRAEASEVDGSALETGTTDSVAQLSRVVRGEPPRDVAGRQFDARQLTVEANTQIADYAKLAKRRLARLDASQPVRRDRRAIW